MVAGHDGGFIERCGVRYREGGDVILDFTVEFPDCRERDGGFDTLSCYICEGGYDDIGGDEGAKYVAVVVDELEHLEYN